MKTLIKKSVKEFSLILSVTFTALVLAVGCAAPKPMPDPLAGFHEVDIQHLDNNRTIADDYKAYIQTLSPEERKYLGTTFFYEDGAGQRAVKIEIGLNGTWWQHVLIYDKDNQRIKTIKYSNGGYRS
jgi:hypothetical protein